jgi:spore coat polysaccharide biosynthesis protein SpsF
MDKGMILGIIQVRIDSTRLPGKVLKEIDNKPLLWYLYERVSFSKELEKVVIATVNNESNLPIIKFAQENKIEYYAGSEYDIIDRLYQTARKFGGKIIVRITGDCPLIDPIVIDKVTKFYLDNKYKYDYVSNTVKPTYPDGLDVEVIPFTTIKKAWNNVKNPFCREWICSYIVEHPESYRIGNVKNEKDLSYLRWTVDYEEDFVFITHIFKRLYPIKKKFYMDDILKLLEKEPWLKEINNKYKRNVSYYEARKNQKEIIGCSQK